MHPEDGRVVSNFIVQALSGKNITIYGDGEQTRSFCYVDDLINGFVSLMKSDNNFVGPVNLGNPQEFTINKLAEKIVKMTNSNSKIVHKALPMDDPLQRKPDISLAKESLDWLPTIQLDTGLKKTIDYFSSII